ncbi:MAG: copper resistance system multicopper oxidase, partial [Rhodospirillales bacterium]|nr:copper resistance system multicopper oxidase [Rhodospirillales bacterium]
SFRGIMPGETFTYRFPVKQSGTYWFHSHSGFQEQTGVFGSIVIRPHGGFTDRFDRDYVVTLSDWTDQDPETVLSNLKFQADYYNFNQRTVPTFFADVQKQGLGATISDRLMWGRMRMSPTDLLDVTGHLYTYLLNGQPPGANWTALFRPGERVRLRFINTAAMTLFDVRIPGLKMTVVAADGIDVQPIAVDEFRMGVAETYDVIVEPGDGAYTIFAQSLDRTGYARGTLATRPGMAAAVPPLDPPATRTMVDMGMGDMAGMDMGGGGSMAGMAHGPQAGTAQGANRNAVPGMEHGSMPGMDHGGMAGMDMGSGGGSVAGMNHGGTAGMGQGGGVPDPMKGKLKRGVEVDNVAEAPIDRLGDPGIGLEGRGRRVLVYTDLRARTPNADPRPPTREIVLHLTGNMQRFIWGFDGKKFSEAGPIIIQRNERVRITMINDTMMEHPMHLHGMFQELENGQGSYAPLKHTVTVKPGGKLSYVITGEPGRWAFHCHLLMHMEMGMFREVRVV